MERGGIVVLRGNLAPDGALYVERVMQANTGADLDFLTGCRGNAIPRKSH